MTNRTLSPTNGRQSKRLASKIGVSGLSGIMMLCGTALAAPAAAATATQPIAFEQCKPGVVPPDVAALAECGSIVVKENRDKKNGRTIKLPILRFASPAEHKADPVFVLNGGPGEVNVNIGKMHYLEAVRADRDVYYVGYRGADDAEALKCPEMAPVAAMAKPLSDATLAEVSKAIGACATRLTKSGIDLSHYTIFDVIEDLEQTRVALGHDKVNLFSKSYGARIAQYYTRKHPGSVARSVMFAANAPGHFVWSAYANDKVLGRVVELCAADPACAAKTPDLGKTIRAALTAGARTGNAALDDDRSRLLLFVALFSRQNTQRFIEAAVALEKGDPKPLVELNGFVSTILGSTIWGDLMAKGGIDAYRYADFAPTFAMSETSMGSPFDALNAAAVKAWPVAATPAEFRRAALDPTPTLVFNGNIDISVPVMFTEAELMPYLPNGKLVVLKDYSHNDYVRQKKAFDAAIAEFLRSGRVDTSGIVDDPFALGK
jgi:pimeloyl-ACP methyl ester carboxylesterase